MDCEPKSLVSALIQCCELGLEPLNALGQISLVPFWNGRAKQFEVQIIPGYGVTSPWRTTPVKSSTLRPIVCTIRNLRDYLWDGRSHQHTPKPPRKEARPKSGPTPGRSSRTDHQDNLHVCGRDLQHREVSQGAWEWDYAPGSQTRQGRQQDPQPEGPWAKWEDEMFCKTAIRKQAKMLPLSPEYGNWSPWRPTPNRVPLRRNPLISTISRDYRRDPRIRRSGSDRQDREQD